MNNRKVGNLLIYASLLVTFLLWVLAKDSIGETVSWPLVSLTQISALLGTMLFVWSMILSTRLDFLESWFGGLDKVYKVHRRVSSVGAVLILIHPVTLVVSNLQIGLKYFLPIQGAGPLEIPFLRLLPPFFLQVFDLFETFRLFELQVFDHLLGKLDFLFFYGYLAFYSKEVFLEGGKGAFSFNEPRLCLLDLRFKPLQVCLRYGCSFL